LPDNKSKNAEQATQEASPWVDRIARTGYTTKEAVYLVVGALAFAAAIGMGGRTTDPPGALSTISTKPLGWLVLGFVAIGLTAYVLWRLVQAVADPEGEGHDLSGIGSRIGHGAAALGYSVLAFTAGQLVVTSGGGSSPKDWTASFLSLPFGWVVVLGVGMGVVGYGLYELYNTYQADFEEHLNLDQMSKRVVSWMVVQVGRSGLAARGIVIGIAGVFLIVAALRFDPSEATGLGGALQELLKQPFGSWLLGVAALGLTAYGLLMLAVARYGQIALGRPF
jgi:hypothetical protein